MKSKLGFFLNTIESRQEQIDKILRARPVTIKSPSNSGLINTLHDELGDETVFIAREQSMDQDFRRYLGDDTPEQGARRWMNDMRGFMQQSPFAYWESINEMTDWGMLEAYGRFEAERVRLMAAEGFKACVGNFSIGSPKISDHDNDGRVDEWPLLYPMLQAAHEHHSILGLHEGGALWLWFYYGPNSAEAMKTGETVHFPEGYHEGWLGKRYRKVWRRHIVPNGWTNIRIALTEMCVDEVERSVTSAIAGYATGPWKSCTAAWEQLNGRTDGEMFYAEQCIWDDHQMQKDPYMIGCNLYVWGTLWGWLQWDISGVIADTLLAHIEASHHDDTPVPDVPTVTPLAGAKDGLFVRNGPSMQHQAVGTVYPGDALEVMSGLENVGRKGEWLKVMTPAGSGWVAAWWVK